MKNRISLIIVAAAVSIFAALPVAADTNNDNNHNRVHKRVSYKHHGHKWHAGCRHATYRRHHPRLCGH